ncbi:acyltransferase [Patescibacteria group bacterium]
MKDKTGKELSLQEVNKKAANRAYSYWLDFKIMLLRWVGYLPSHFIRKFCYRMAGIKLGKGSTIHMWAKFFQSKNIEIGEDSIIGDHCFLDGRASLKIGSHVAIASQVLIYNSQHNVDDKDFKAIEKPVEIGDYVFIGPRAIILPGVTIGKGAVVAAGAVVAKDVETLSVVGGVPAKEIRKRNLKDLHYKLGRARLFQ